MHQENNNKNHFNSFVRVAFLILLAVFIVSLVRNVSRSYDANRRITQANSDLNKLETESVDLKKELDISTTYSFKEKEVRDKLGLAKEGDIVLVLPSAQELRKLAPERKAKEEAIPDPNWKKWLKLFF